MQYLIPATALKFLILGALGLAALGLIILLVLLLRDWKNKSVW